MTDARGQKDAVIAWSSRKLNVCLSSVDLHLDLREGMRRE
jgi:hypothetical protein